MTPKNTDFQHSYEGVDGCGVVFRMILVTTLVSATIATFVLGVFLLLGSYTQQPQTTIALVI